MRTDRVLALGVVAALIVGFGWHESRRLGREVAGLRRSVQVAEQERRGLLERVDAERRGNEAERVRLESHVEELRQRERDVKGRLAAAGDSEAASLRDELAATQARLAALESERSAGQPMMVMGYPTGLEAILAKAESGVVKQILESQGPSSERVTEALSRQGLIRPTTTQGHIGDVTGTDIVFDAPTTQGGSGGPIFNKEGQVNAVEYALLTKFGGNSFAIPISYAIELLQPAS